MSRTMQQRRRSDIASPRKNTVGNSRRRLGAAVVEFAVVAPVFFAMVFGMIEFGRVVMVQQVLTNAAREGARVAVLDGSTSGQVTTTVTDYLSNASISGSTATVSPSTLTASSAGDPITVTVSVPFSQVSWLPSSWFFASSQLTSSTVMRREASP